MPMIIPIDDTITAIDHGLLGMPGIGVTYVVRGDADRVALIETGTSLTVPATLAGLDQLGIPRAAIQFIICTHIHMDHSGGAWLLAEALPNAGVYINSTVAGFLADPERLLSSTRRAVGEALWPRQGDMQPLPLTRLHPSEALDLDLGRGVTLRAIASPGHSADHIAFFAQHNGALVAGDSCGVAMPLYGVGPRPVTPPPGFDLVAQIATYERLRALPIRHLLVTHCGPVDSGAVALAQQHQYMLDAVEIIGAAIARGDLDVARMAGQLFPAADHPVLRVWSEMSIAGIVRYLQKQALAQA